MINWTPALETGHPVIDADHKKLIATLNQLDASVKRGAGNDEMARIIAFLNNYTREHFSREQNYMIQIRCPAHDENCRAHAELIQKLDGWVQRLNGAGATTSLVLEVYRETNKWIQQHILKIDCQARGCAKLHGAGAR